VDDGVGGQLGRHEDRLVSNGASVEDGPQVGSHALDLFRPAWVWDLSQVWTEIRYATLAADSSSYFWTAVGAESFHGGAYFDPVTVTYAEVDQAPIGQYNPEADEEQPSLYDGTAGLDPSQLDASGMDFSFYWNGSPSLAPGPANAPPVPYT
jgi:hypothetical protein